MPAISFSVFKEQILSGAKRQTIRKSRKYPIVQGDVLFMWWKQRTSDRQHLGNTVCSKISSVEIHEDLYLIEGVVISDTTELDKFAQADGFKDWDTMAEWFEETHGLPFLGELIEWGYPLVGEVAA